MPSEPRPDDALELLAAPPADYSSLLEFAPHWSGLDGVQAQLAAALRLFVITRDPLDWLTDRGSAWATANADGETLELPLYVTLEKVQRQLEMNAGDLEAPLGTLAEAALVNATQSQGSILSGAYPDLAFQGTIPRLLDRPAAPGSLGAVTIEMRATAWEPLGLAVVQDLVQDAFGPVDFDRSAVALQPERVPHPGCPACAGGRFGFPGELTEARAAMCPAHRTAASTLTASRIEHARASNPVGWRAISTGSARISDVPEAAGTPIPQHRGTPPRRNAPCPCGSGRKYKHCCGR